MPEPSGPAPSSPAHTFDEIADGVFAFVQPDGSWCLSNAGVIRGGDRTVVVDTAATIVRARALRQHALAVGGDRPRLVVNTHQHGDHTFGNCVFAADSTVIGHETARIEQDQAGLGLTRLWPDVDWGPIEIALPTVTYSERMRIHTEAGPVELHHVPAAHTCGDTVVWLPEQRVLFAGDLVMNGVTPFCLMGSVRGMLAALDRLQEFPAEVIVPGHGPVCGAETVERTRAYLEWVSWLARAGVSAGLTPIEVAHEADHSDWSDLLDDERLVANLHRCYAELAGAADGAAIDEMAAFGQMLEFHGGLPRCDA